MERNILCVHTPDLYEASLEFLPYSITTGAGLELRVYDGAPAIQFEGFTDVIMLGFSLSFEEVEKMYLANLLHILTIDRYYEEHPLRRLAVDKNGLYFTTLRGKWAILLDDKTDYKSVIRKLINET